MSKQVLMKIPQFPVEVFIYTDVMGFQVQDPVPKAVFETAKLRWYFAPKLHKMVHGVID